MILLPADFRDVIIWCSSNTSSCFLDRSHKKVSNEVRRRIPKTENVQNQGADDIIQPNNKSKRSAGGTRLRLRLSSIFHRDNVESGFLCVRLPAPGTKGKSHLPICQSPRIHR